MKFTVEKARFLPVIKLLAGAAEKRGVMPILSHVLISAAGTAIHMAATDLNTVIEADIPCVGFAEDGQIAIPAAGLLSVCKDFPAEHITATPTDGGVLLTASRVKYKLPALGAGDFPALPKSGQAQWVSIDGAALADALGRASTAVDLTDKTRENFHGVYLVREGERLKVCAASGLAKLALCRRPLAAPESGLMLPIRGVEQICKCLEGTREAEIAYGKEWIFVRVGAVLTAVKQTAFAFPDKAATGIADAKRGQVAIVDRNAFASAVHRLRQQAIDDDTKGRFSFSPGWLVIETRDLKGQSGREEIGIEYDGPPTLVVLSLRYLSELLPAIDGEKITIGMGGQDPVNLHGDGEDVISLAPIDSRGESVALPEGA